MKRLNEDSETEVDSLKSKREELIWPEILSEKELNDIRISYNSNTNQNKLKRYICCLCGQYKIVVSKEPKYQIKVLDQLKKICINQIFEVLRNLQTNFNMSRNSKDLDPDGFCLEKWKIKLSEN